MRIGGRNQLGNTLSVVRLTCVKMCPDLITAEKNVQTDLLTGSRKDFSSKQNTKHL